MRDKHNTAEEVCVRLLRYELWGIPLEVPVEHDDWEAVVRIAKKQSVLGLVGNRILNTPEITKNLRPELKTKIRSFIMANVVMHQQLNHAILKH